MQPLGREVGHEGQHDDDDQGEQPPRIMKCSKKGESPRTNYEVEDIRPVRWEY